MGLAYYPKNATYQVVNNYDITIFIINSNLPYTGKIDYPTLTNLVISAILGWSGITEIV